MTEPHEPYITGRKKVVTMKIAVPEYVLDAAQIAKQVKELLEHNGYKITGIEVTYEES